MSYTKPHIPRHAGEEASAYLVRVLSTLGRILKWPASVSCTQHFYTAVATLLTNGLVDRARNEPRGLAALPALATRGAFTLRDISHYNFVGPGYIPGAFSLMVWTVEEVRRAGDPLYFPHPLDVAYYGFHLASYDGSVSDRVDHHVVVSTSVPVYRQWLSYVHELVHVALFRCRITLGEDTVHSIASVLWGEFVNDEKGSFA